MAMRITSLPVRPSTVAVLAGVSLVSLGFGLDKGELACEQAAVQLQACCPDLDVTRMDCTQVGGCSRTRESTAVTLEESACIQESTCEDIRARRVCERLVTRVVEAGEAGGPNIGELYEADPLCE
jgi:hypothetical protein